MKLILKNIYFYAGQLYVGPSLANIAQLLQKRRPTLTVIDNMVSLTLLNAKRDIQNLL